MNILVQNQINVVQFGYPKQIHDCDNPSKFIDCKFLVYLSHYFYCLLFFRFSSCLGCKARGSLTRCKDITQHLELVL